MGSDLRGAVPFHPDGYFNPRSPQGERHKRDSQKSGVLNFNPRSPQGERLHQFRWIIFGFQFQSTLPAGGATRIFQRLLQTIYNFNPRSPQGERRLMPNCAAATLVISIHAPRRGSDNADVEFRIRPIISIHAPRRGSDGYEKQLDKLLEIFQSTLPAGGATSRHSNITRSPLYFNPRSPQGERQRAATFDKHQSVFQSTLPAGGATKTRTAQSQKQRISIHAPRRGSDLFMTA